MVVLRDAFRPEFAEMVYSRAPQRTLQELESKEVGVYVSHAWYRNSLSGFGLRRQAQFVSQTHLWVQTEHGHTFAPPSIGLSGLWARAGSVRIVRWKIEERKPRGKGLSLHPFPPNNGSRARYSELMDKGVSWELNEAYFPDGYGLRMSKDGQSYYILQVLLNDVRAAGDPGEPTDTYVEFALRVLDEVCALPSHS